MDNLEVKQAKQPQKLPSADDINPLVLLKQPQLFRSTFLELSCDASEAMRAQDNQTAVNLLAKCAEMLEYGKNILKDISPFWKICVFGNLACAYQGLWKVPNSHRFCDKAEKELLRLKEVQESREIRLKITMHLIKLRFQHCALISQMDQHEKALETCKSTLPLLIEVIHQILDYIQSSQSRMANQKHSKGSQMNEYEENQYSVVKNQNESVEFATQVAEYASSTMKQLQKTIKDPIQQTGPIVSLRRGFFFWKSNPQRNEEQVKQKFVPKQNSGSKRSILGVNKVKHWIDDFNIGGIMHMSQLNLADFQSPPPFQEYLFKDRLYELIIYCSVAHFTIATQLRFIDGARQRAIKNEEKKREQQRKGKIKQRKEQAKEREREEKKQSKPQRISDPDKQSQEADVDNNSEQPLQRQSSLQIQQENAQKQQEKEDEKQPQPKGVDSIQKKYGFQQRTQTFKESEMYHLRAIDMMASNIKFTVPYLSHLIQSYDKHYIHKKQLEPIVAIVEESVISINDVRGIHQQNQQKARENQNLLEQDEDLDYLHRNDQRYGVELDQPNNRILGKNLESVEMDIYYETNEEINGHGLKPKNLSGHTIKNRNNLKNKEFIKSFGNQFPGKGKSSHSSVKSPVKLHKNLKTPKGSKQHEEKAERKKSQPRAKKRAQIPLSPRRKEEQIPQNSGKIQKCEERNEKEYGFKRHSSTHIKIVMKNKK